MTKRKPKPVLNPNPERAPKNLRTLISEITDPVKQRLVEVLIDLAKKDVRAAQLWAQVSGEGGSVKSPAPMPCCFTMNLSVPTPKDDDDPIEYEHSPVVPEGWDEDEPYEEESDEERQSRW